jgi:hypothetical protein
MQVCRFDFQYWFIIPPPEQFPIKSFPEIHIFSSFSRHPFSTISYHPNSTHFAVNVAARMESHGHAGRIHISIDTFKLLKDTFECEARGFLEVKGKGKLPTFFLIQELTTEQTSKMIILDPKADSGPISQPYNTVKSEVDLRKLIRNDPKLLQLVEKGRKYPICIRSKW